LSGLNINQTSVANALDKAFNSGVPAPPSFAALFGLPANAVPFALTQLSGEIGTGAPTAAFQTIDQFLNLMLDPFLQTQFGNGTTQERALSFAPPSSVQARLPGELLSYDSMITKAPRMVAPTGRWTVWGAAYGAAGRFTGDAVIGSNTLKINSGNFAVGVDYRVSRSRAAPTITGSMRSVPAAASWCRPASTVRPALPTARTSRVQSLTAVTTWRSIAMLRSAPRSTG
jgi:uncharacterized protein with beta-barrel porin domain